MKDCMISGIYTIFRIQRTNLVKPQSYWCRRNVTFLSQKAKGINNTRVAFFWHEALLRSFPMKVTQELIKGTRRDASISIWQPFTARSFLNTNFLLNLQIYIFWFRMTWGESEILVAVSICKILWVEANPRPAHVAYFNRFRPSTYMKKLKQWKYYNITYRACVMLGVYDV